MCFFVCSFEWRSGYNWFCYVINLAEREKEGERAKNLNVKYNQSSKEKLQKKYLNGERGY